MTDVFVHATTVVTNAVIERKGPLMALLVTDGFRDILSIRDEHRYEMFDPQIEFPKSLVSREMTFGIAERVLATGEALKPLDVAQAEATVEDLKSKAVVSVAVSFLNAYLNPVNERAMRDCHRKARTGNVCLDFFGSRAANPGISTHIYSRNECLYGTDHGSLSRCLTPWLEAARVRQ